MKRLDGKTCVITGAASGIGEAIARSFSDEGATVIVTDINDEGGQAVANEISAVYMHLDVSVEGDWQKLEEAHPQVDVVVNNAGITGFESGAFIQDPENVTLENWRAVHHVNLDGTFLGCRYAIRAMKKKGEGSIINMSSRSGLVGIPGAAAYASSKAAIRNHTKTVALYCAQNGWNIRCNSIHPAAIMTPMWETMLGDGPDREEREAAMVADTPMRRFGTSEEVANLCVMLGSDEVAYMTGAELTVDGGLLSGSAASPAVSED